MIVDSLKYSGKCPCGREHAMATRFAVIEKGCLTDFEKWMEELSVTGKRCALYGKHSYAATEGRHPKADQEIILNPDGLHADEKSTAEVLSRMDSDIEVLIAIGSGTIHDIARFCAHERGIRFVSCPTAASVDGFCSTVAAMTWYGYKKTMPAVAPEAVIADTDIISKAPIELVRSGVGDILAKYTARADWEIAHLLTGEYLCPRIRDIMAEAVETVTGSIPGILAGNPEAYASVTYALVMSGIAMQMMGNSRPASGAEHHISHCIEMEPAMLPVRFPALHGEKTGVGSVLAAKEYERLAEIEDITPYLREYRPVSGETFRTFFGAKTAAAVMEENRADCLSGVTPEDVFDFAVDALHLTQLGAKHTLEEIGISSADREKLLKYSPLVRNRLTLMRIRRMIGTC